MHSLAQEIRSFSRANLRKQRTRVTTLTGRRIIETWRGACLQVEEDEEVAPGGGGGYVPDLSADLQVGVVKPWLLLGEWDRGQRREAPGRWRRALSCLAGAGVRGGPPLERLRFVPRSEPGRGRWNTTGPGASRSGGAAFREREFSVATGWLCLQGRRTRRTTWRP